ncbi:MAG: hypothetical protein ACRENP_30130 [Longimicrobiales bacterium]
MLGDPTEAALRVVAAKAGIDLEREAGRSPRFREFPFDSRRKRMTAIHKKLSVISSQFSVRYSPAGPERRGIPSREKV